MKIVIAFALLLLSARCYSQQMTYKDLIGVWRGHWEIDDSTKPYAPGSLEVTDSVNAGWRLWTNQLTNFTYTLKKSRTSDKTMFVMTGVNYQNDTITTLAYLTKCGNDTLKIQWLVNTATLSKKDTSQFKNTVILVRGKGFVNSTVSFYNFDLV
ncbi:MAG TPA: hypothetical protein VKR53_16625 [Puia sp.]|nr:hypothetical protein [Puia sp.]